MKRGLTLPNMVIGNGESIIAGPMTGASKFRRGQGSKYVTVRAVRAGTV